MTAVLWWSLPPVAWSAAMCVREWVHTRQHSRRVVRHQMAMEAHDARIEQALLLGERSQLEDKLQGLMSDALRTALGDAYPETTPLHDETALLMFDAQLHAIDTPDDLGWDTP